MSKYCIYRDRPIGTIMGNNIDETAGCMIFNVWHKCIDCPNNKEMGDGSAIYASAKENNWYD